MCCILLVIKFIISSAIPQGGHEINYFGKPFLAYRYYTLSLSVLCPGVDNISLTMQIMHYTIYKLYGHALAHESMPQGS